MPRIPPPPRAGGAVPPPCSVRVLQLAVLAHCRHELGQIYEEGRSRWGGGPGELMLVFPSAEEMMRNVVRHCHLTTLSIPVTCFCIVHSWV
jgi:hypothetical protein